MGCVRLAAQFTRGCTYLRALIFDDVNTERYRQLDKWGEQRHPNRWHYSDIFHYQSKALAYQKINDQFDGIKDAPGWDSILLEEIYEALAESDTAKLREELVQSAAVIMAWIEDIDSRE